MIQDLCDVLRERADSPSKVFIVSKFGRYSYGEIQTKVLDLATFLKEEIRNLSLEVKKIFFLIKGDGEIAHIVSILASLELGVPFVPYNRAWSRFNDGSQEFTLIECKGDQLLFGNKSISILDLSNFSKVSLHDYTVNDRQIERLACLFPTSGTTGFPKLIAVSNLHLAKGAVFVTQSLEIVSSDVIAGILSLDFDYGINQLFGCLIVGGTYICCQISTATHESLDQLEMEGPTILAVMPFIVDTYFPGIPKNKYPTVRLITSSGGPLTLNHRSQIQSICRNGIIIPMYGMSEGFRATISTAKLDKHYPESVGFPIGDTEITIRNQVGDILPSGEVGEVWQAGGCLSWGYWRDLSGNKVRFVNDSDLPNKIWLKSGDLGYLNKEGALFIVGRLSFQIKKFGLRISIDEVEYQISRALSGLVCVAVPVQTSTTESDFEVFIQSPQQQLSSISEKIRGTLPSELWPRRIFCVDKIPFNVYGGKPDRQQLLIWSKSQDSSMAGKLTSEVHDVQ
jgi:acyl-CoA synthetase (AMP-forming)/AMP-acid ligase II